MSASKPGQEAEEEDIGEAVPESKLTSDIWQKDSSYLRLILTSFTAWTLL